MLPDFGFYLLLLCCISSVYGCASAIAAAFFRHRRLYRSSRLALSATCVMMVAASAILVYALFQRDYSVAYVFKNSSNDLPAFYTFTAFWSALEGSHMLWTLLLTVYATIALWTYAKDNEHIMPYVSATLQAVLAWMFYLAISYSDPFVRMFPSHPNGLGMNTLLQNPYMAAHPPSLFTGYTSLAIPFAYSIAALCYGDVTEGWLKTTRRWTLYAWCFLTTAIFLGGHWAYIELGWSGYWAWDPVENSSFLPWLCATALLHSLLVQEKLGHLKRHSLILAICAFFLSFFGTFITRSGVISSVHAFAESPIGPNYLIFLGAVLAISLGIYAFRAPGIMPAETNKAWGVSKESALVVTQFLILTFATIVFVGTIFPIASEAITGQRISVQAPYFNAFAPWVGLGLILFIAIGNLMRYQTAKLPGGLRTMLLAAIAAVPIGSALVYYGGVLQTPKPFALAAQIVGMVLTAWAISCLVLDLIGRLKQVRFNLRLFLGRNLAYFGAFLAHVGVMVAIIGFLGNYRGVEKEVTLKHGGSAELYGYKFSFDKMAIREDRNVTLFEAPLKVTRNGEDLGQILPARSKYPTKPELMHEVGIMSSFWHDIYVVLADFDRSTGEQVTLQIHINPTVRIVWVSAVLMVFGGLLCLFDRHRGNKSRDSVGAAWELPQSRAVEA